MGGNPEATFLRSSKPGNINNRRLVRRGPCVVVLFLRRAKMAQREIQDVRRQRGGIMLGHIRGHCERLVRSSRNESHHQCLAGGQRPLFTTRAR